MKENRVECLIRLTGEEHDTDIVAYGMEALRDGGKTFFVIMLLGAISHHILDSILYLLFSFIGTSTLGGVSL